MHTPQTRANLDRCRAALARAEVSDDMRKLADDLLDRLVSMHDARRLSIPVFMLALDSLELVEGLEESVTALRAAASRELNR